MYDRNSRHRFRQQRTENGLDLLQLIDQVGNFADDADLLVAKRDQLLVECIFRGVNLQRTRTLFNPDSEKNRQIS